ncbi:hypothetical protein IAR55_006002 [Kwoniella newhampshirensis]|uniref:Cyclohexanone monooxygenase n=1 Tax=Kwoniella newhampshirensis TaxID=1651941 RepID=A0AAW0YJH1_9TREE
MTLIADSKPNGVHSKEPSVPYIDSPNYLYSRKKLRIVVIGSGFAGIYFALRAAEKLKDVEVQIYERHNEVGGTWLANTYLGAACDFPCHIYTYTFAPNPNWSRVYAGQAEILEYLKDVADRYNVRKAIKFKHTVKTAFWNEVTAQWDLTIEHEGEIIKDSADVFINASGVLTDAKLTVPGIYDFEGPMLHSAEWDSSVEFKDKNVALIGNGSSAIQLLPQLQKMVKNIDNYVRNPTWITPAFASDLTIEKGSNDNNPLYTEEQKKTWREDPEAFLQFRKKLEHNFNNHWHLVNPNGPVQKGARKEVAEQMRKVLASKPDLAESLMPDWAVGCRRVSPGVGYLECLAEDNVHVIRDGIETVTKEGIRTIDGKTREYDIIVAATGYDTSRSANFELVGRDGFRFTPKWKLAPRGYMAIAIENCPNYFVFHGPNAPVGNGSTIPYIEHVGDYMIEAIKKLQTENYRTVMPKTRAIEAFTHYCDTYLEKTIFADSCQSTYKNRESGKIRGLWPGSGCAYIDIIRRPRWEDYEWEVEGGDDMMFHYMGNGFTEAELNGGDQAFYLDDAIANGPPPLP